MNNRSCCFHECSSVVSMLLCLKWNKINAPSLLSKKHKDFKQYCSWLSCYLNRVFIKVFADSECNVSQNEIILLLCKILIWFMLYKNYNESTVVLLFFYFFFSFFFFCNSFVWIMAWRDTYSVYARYILFQYVILLILWNFYVFDQKKKKKRIFFIQL